MRLTGSIGRWVVTQINSFVLVYHYQYVLQIICETFYCDHMWNLLLHSVTNSNNNPRQHNMVPGSKTRFQASSKLWSSPKKKKKNVLRAHWWLWPMFQSKYQVYSKHVARWYWARTTINSQFGRLVLLTCLCKQGKMKPMRDWSSLNNIPHQSLNTNRMVKYQSM